MNKHTIKCSLQANSSNFDIVMESDIGTFAPVGLTFSGKPFILGLTFSGKPLILSMYHRVFELLHSQISTISHDSNLHAWVKATIMCTVMMGLVVKQLRTEEIAFYIPTGKLCFEFFKCMAIWICMTLYCIHSMTV